MNIENGTYQTRSLIQQGDETDNHGRPTPATEEWSEPRPCCVQTISDNRVGAYADGVFRQASFYVLVEPQSFPHRRIRLTRLGEELGEFDVINAEPLMAVGALKIMVSKR